METFFKQGQTCHDRENREVAVERYLASGQILVDTHPASPRVSQIHSEGNFCIIKRAVSSPDEGNCPLNSSHLFPANPGIYSQIYHMWGRPTSKIYDPA
jgi:hypothetical protein